MDEETVDVSKISCWQLIGIRCKKLMIDLTSIKNWTLGILIWAFIMFPGIMDSWAFVLLVMAILGLKDGIGLIAAMRGNPVTTVFGTPITNKM